MTDHLSLELFIDPAQQGEYLLLPFTMPAGVERLELRYEYPRRPASTGPLAGGTYTSRAEANIIDLGLIAPDGEQVGASGSDKLEITVSEVSATAGYRPCKLVPGEWQILAGAYKVAPQGVTVRYELRFHFKATRLYRGDLHTHTLASDGVLTAAELAQRARRHGLDFLAITDHNQPVSHLELPQVDGLTLIPGVEWTHYRGHANFLGVDRPYDGSFHANSEDEIRQRFVSARQRGALITINHPFDECCGFQLDMGSLPWDCLEIWNGPMRESNLRALGLWQQLLAAGKKVPIVGGSDYHRDTPFIFPGGPTTCVYAASASAADLLAAVRAGHAYLTFAPGAPRLAFTAGGAQMGDTAAWPDVEAVHIELQDLQAGDLLRAVTAEGSRDIVRAPEDSAFEVDLPVTGPGFVRLEVWRTFIPGVPALPALISNPIYFEQGEAVK
jgi:hypothetical protein